jgi:predicted esterase
VSHRSAAASLVALLLFSIAAVPRTSAANGAPGAEAPVRALKSARATTATAAPARAGPAPRLLSPARIEATEDLAWNLDFKLINDLDTGVYADSLVCDVEDLDPGETRELRRQSFLAPAVPKLMPSVSAHDSGGFQYRLFASAEHARITCRLFMHPPDHSPLELIATIEALPGPSSALYPTRILTVSGKRVETMLVPAPPESGAAPGILLVHGHGGHARTMMGLAIALSRRGYTVMSASMPGYGLSEGPADFMGPATVRAMMAALDALKRTSGVDSTRLAAWGISRGASVVVDLAEARSDLRAIVAQAGMYDLWACYRGTEIPGIRDNIVAEAGSDSAAWRTRSPALAPERVKAAILFMHGGRDPRVPIAQAQGFADALRARGTAVETRFFPAAGHQLPLAESRRTATEFLARILKR